MARTFSVHDNPWSGLAESVVTSRVLDVRDAFDISVSWYTTSGATSNVTLQISNALDKESIAEGSWSHWTVFGRTAPVSPSAASVFFPPLGNRYIRFIRKVSNASTTVDVNKLVLG